jgi:S-phase kinase-associated protein 1
MIIHFQTGDEKTVVADSKDVMLSELIRTMLEGAEEDQSIMEIPLPIVSEDTLIQFTAHHTEDPMPEISHPLPSGDLHDAVSTWYADYILGVEPGPPLNDLVKCANYMDIDPLIELGCARIATYLRGRTPADIRMILGLNEQQQQQSSQD